MIARIALVLIGGVWSSLCFWLGLWLTFPSAVARDRLVWEVGERSDGAWSLRAEGVRPWWFTGASVSGVQLYRVPATRRRGVEPPPATLMLSSDKLAARLQLLPLLRGVVSAGLGGSLYGGDLSGSVGVQGKRTLVDVLLADVDLSSLPTEGETWSADLSGLLRLRVDAVFDQDEVKNSDGRVRMEISDMKLLSGKLMGFDLPEATFTEALLSFSITDGRAEVRKGSFVSDTLSAELDGSIALNPELGRSRLSLTVAVKLSEDLDTLARLAPGMKDARDDDGAYHFNCLGTLSSPSCMPKSAGRRATTPTRSSSPFRPDTLDEVASEQAPKGLDTPADELARRREERLAERRERIRQRREERLAEEKARAADELDAGEDEPIYDDEPVDLFGEDELDGELPPPPGGPGFPGPAGDEGFDELPPAGDELEDLGYLDE